MIIYSATKQEFNRDVIANDIADKILDKFKRKLGRTTTKQEIDSWKNSMMYMNNVLSDSDIPSNTGVSIEYKIPQTSNRIDFVLTGQDKNKTDTAIIVELKQWSEVRRTDKDAIVETYLGGRLREVNHPSYQAWTYAALLQDFNETIRDDNIELISCAYLHNCEQEDVINHSSYNEHTSKAPSFLRNDTQRLQSFIKQYVKYGDANNIMYRIDNGKIKPSKNLADVLVSLMQGNAEFYMVDDQKLVFETVLSLADEAAAEDKKVLIVEGGPGTGKSVVAINLLVELTRQEKLVHYVTKNAAPREVYSAKLTGSFKKSHINNLFKGSGSYHSSEPNSLEVLIVDEAHRLNEKSGMYQNIGENQIKEIINAAQLSVFFIDEDQRVTWKDIGEKQEIIKWADHAEATVHELELASQFRCNGSDGYLAWLDNGLQIRKTANETLEGIDYDFRVFDSPNQLRDAIFEKNKENNKARLVAGYCWDWVSKKDTKEDDIVFGEHGFSMKWNLASDGNLWIMKPEAVKEIGCIHTCQGLELDYIGVIVGPDFVVRGGMVITDAALRSKMDSSVKGYKKLLKESPEKAKVRADSIIKNTYRTLMTRGQKGCYIYCTDPETNAYFKGLVSEIQEEQLLQEEQILPFRKMLPEEVRPYENAVPLYDLEVAAGEFSDPQYIDDYDWVELPDSFLPQNGHFVTKVVGESMNKRIPNGAWCLFKTNPGGTRNNKIVLVQHRDIQDQDTGATFTVKRYCSEKVDFEGEWKHSKIVLKPDSYIEGYMNLELEEDALHELKVIGEFVAVLG